MRAIVWGILAGCRPDKANLALSYDALMNGFSQASQPLPVLYDHQRPSIGTLLSWQGDPLTRVIYGAVLVGDDAVIQQIASRALPAFSIGFDVVRGHRDDGIWIGDAIVVKELSVVRYAADQDSKIQRVQLV